MTENSPPILTFGYGARPLQETLRLLGAHGVQYVVDVRSSPWSRHRPEYNHQELAGSLAEVGIHYVFMGAELGGRPDDPECYDEDGRVDYRRCRERPRFTEGIARLLDAHNQRLHVAIMCSEGRPEDCHRTKLVAQELSERGAQVVHLDRDGQAVKHDEVMLRIVNGQMALLGDGDQALHKSRGRYQTTAQ
jgi:uncharacterized protein (DUF488 family)